MNVSRTSNDDLRQRLREAYGRQVDERDLRTPPWWEVEERDIFVALLQQEQKRSVLEVGAGTGVDSAYFQDLGFDVTCTDLSPEMVSRCRAKGLTASVMDVAALQFPPEAFDAIYAMNCLVHVPHCELSHVIHEIRRTLKSTGLFYLGQYGGYEHEGALTADPYEPKRFFAVHTDACLRQLLEQTFEVHTFRQRPHGWAGLHFQSFILRKRVDDPQHRTRHPNEAPDGG